MKVKVMELEEKDYNGRDILFPKEVEIETNDISFLSNGQRTVCVDKSIVYLTNKSFKDLKRELIRTKIYEKIMVL